MAWTSYLPFRGGMQGVHTHTHISFFQTLNMPTYQSCRLFTSRLGYSIHTNEWQINKKESTCRIPRLAQEFPHALYKYNIIIWQTIYSAGLTLSLQCKIPTIPAIKPQVPNRAAPVSSTRRLGVMNRMFTHLQKHKGLLLITKHYVLQQTKINSSHCIMKSFNQN